MKRLLPACLGLSVLLTACPGPSWPTPTVSVSGDDRVLQGRWVGELVEQVRVSAVTVGGGRVYLLDGSNWQRERLLVLDLASGARLASLPLPGAHSLASRADGGLVVLGGRGLTVHDPVTLEVRESRVVAGNLLSPDGEVVSDLSGTTLRRYSARTGEPLPTVSPSASTEDSSSDAGWWLAGGRAVRVGDGRSMGGASAHGDPCGLTQGLRPVSIESAPGDRVLLGFSDGVVELREADGSLVNAFPVSEGCWGVQDLRRVGEGVAFLTAPWPSQDGEAGVLDLTTGAVSARQQLPQAEVPGSRLTAGGVLLNTYRSEITRDETGFQPWAAPRWALALEDRRLTLDVQALRRDDSTADVTGTATLEERDLRVAGTLAGWNVVFAQTSPPPPPTLSPDLALLDGSEAVGSLSGSSWVTGDTGAADARPHPPTYRVQLSLKDDPRTYVGQLRRP